MPFNGLVPLRDGSSIELGIETGNPVFIVGPNGSGKSSLMHYIALQNPQVSNRITAHRQNWLNSDNVDMSPKSRKQSEGFIKNNDKQTTSRWRDDHANARTDMTIFDLLDAENVRSRLIAEFVDKNDITGAQNAAQKAGPLSRLNYLLSASNISVRMSLLPDDSLMASREGGPNYSVAELSDGERNALLLAAIRFEKRL